MEKHKVILTSGLVVMYAVTHVGLGADVPGKPLTLLNNIVTLSSSASSGSLVISAPIPNMSNPYGQDFQLPAKDPRASKTIARST